MESRNIDTGLAPIQIGRFMDDDPALLMAANSVPKKDLSAMKSAPATSLFITDNDLFRPNLINPVTKKFLNE